MARKKKVLKKVKTFSKDGTINLSSDELNDDWIRSWRLLKAAQAGDKEAQKEYDRRDGAPMMEYKPAKKRKS